MDADVICVGHTHHPYVLEVGNQLVVNPGSVGQPRDRDPRASYAVLELENRAVELKRIAYAVEDTLQVIRESSLSDADKEMLSETYRNGTAPNGVKNSRVT